MTSPLIAGSEVEARMRVLLEQMAASESDLDLVVCVGLECYKDDMVGRRAVSRARTSGFSRWHKSIWRITDAGRAWLAEQPQRAAAA